MELSDRELVLLARAGDRQAFAVLLVRHRAAMHAVAVARLGPGADVEDVVQDASLVALTSLRRLRDPALVRSWLTGITRNVCRDRMRGVRMVELPDVADEAPGPEERCERLAIHDWVWGAVNALSEPLHHAVLLRYFSSARSYESIAQALGVPVGTVRSRLNHARRILAAQLSDLAGSASPDHGALERDRTALFAGIAEQYNRGAELALLRTALVPDARLTAAGTSEVILGRDLIVRGIGEDVAVGVGLRLLNVIAGRDLTVVEGAFINPPDDPAHCPPLTTQVFFHRGPEIAALHLHYGRE
ncbi:RNA polymerase sigma factor RpoE [Alloactinosynnema sp. L-07]|nr:RNA polymerase sigma factor RpoE [Alloactinosynnema sp. L-07]